MQPINLGHQELEPPKFSYNLYLDERHFSRSSGRSSRRHRHGTKLLLWFLIFSLSYLCFHLMLLQLNMIMIKTWTEKLLSGEPPTMNDHMSAIPPVDRIKIRPDQVLSLPGLDFPINFRHYSGYLKTSNGSYLHYWFFESQNDPDTDPVVLWLNGGPGCSSLLGALSENGPFKIGKDQRTLEMNPFAWNQRASMLYLESPPGVGFSFTSNPQHFPIGDKVTAHLNWQAIQGFFREFPHLLNNDFYVTGESYAGIYVPMLAQILVEKKFPPNLKGFAIGNGFMDYEYELRSLPYFYYYHGLISQKEWTTLLQLCHCYSEDQQTENGCNFAKSIIDNQHDGSTNSTNNRANEECSIMLNNLFDFDNIHRLNLNQYNIYANCRHTVSFSGCLDGDDLESYLNQYSTKRALNVKTRLNWSTCNEAVYNEYSHDIVSVRPQIQFLLANGLKGLIYNGDIDAVCNFLGAQWFVDSLNLTSSQPYKAWFYSGQIGGFHQSFENLTIATVRGAGHMVPGDKPGPMQELFHKFLDGFSSA